MSPQQRLIAIAAATAIAVPAEGLRQYAYRDPPGIWTVCFGSTTDVQVGRRYTLDECRERLDRDMLSAVRAVEACAPGAPWQVVAAFSDAVYNLGPTIACAQDKSTAARLLAAHEYEAACRQLPRWDKARVGGLMVTLPGLAKRREAGMGLCLEGVEG